jgi:putative membrane protein
MSTTVRLATAIAALSAAQFAAQFAAAADLSHKDTTYLTKTAQGLMSEVALGEMAQKNAADERVKQFGKRMVDDHGKDLENLKQLAGQRKVTLPSSPDSSQQKEADKLAKLSGKDFDKEYVKYEAKDHKEDVKEQGEEMKATSDPDLKKFATAAYDTVSKHKESIDALQKALDAK